MPAPLACAASTLVAEVLDTAPTWVEETRTPVSVHLSTGDEAVPVVCVATQEAIRLPYTVVVPELPAAPFALRAARWWTPPRPYGLAPVPGRRSSRYDDVDPASLLGRGAGLTPDGDDVLAGALVAGHATGHPSLPRWRRETAAALATRRTTAVSVGMLHAALDGWATPELADAVEALCRDDADPGAAVDRLLAVGHSSGRSLLDGVLHALATHPLTTRGAA